MNNEQMIPGGMDVTSWTIITPGQPNDYFMGTIEEAYEHARKEYGIAASIRETWYGEWDCGSGPDSACHYDRYGKHHVRNGVTCTECGNSFRADQVNDHGNGEKFCEFCQ